MSEPTSQTPSGRDDVFNDETCRALRQKGYDAVRVLVPVFTFLLFLFAAALQGNLTILGLWMEVMVGAALSLVFAVTFIAELRWFGVSFYRETFREMKRDLIREVRAIAGDPEVIESRIGETSGPTARPELVFGLAPEECATVFLLPFMALFVAVSEFEGLAVILSIAACIASSGVLFALVNHSPAKVSTYPPEDPPHEHD